MDKSVMQITFKDRDPIPVKAVIDNDVVEVISTSDVIKKIPRANFTIHFNDLEVDKDEIYSIYKDDYALSEITIENTHTKESWIHLGYMIRVSLVMIPDSEDDNNTIIMMTLAQLTEVDKSLRTMAGIVSKNRNYLSFDQYQSALIEESNDKLEEYLANHPLVSNCHGDIYKAYNATKDKRNLFTSAMLSYMLKLQAGYPNPVLKWNSTGDECEEWTQSEGIQFAIEVDAYVAPLVSAQQQYEIAIRSATTKAELDKISIDYSQVATINHTELLGMTTQEAQDYLDVLNVEL